MAWVQNQLSEQLDDAGLRMDNQIELLVIFFNGGLCNVPMAILSLCDDYLTALSSEIGFVCTVFRVNWSTDVH